MNGYPDFSVAGVHATRCDCEGPCTFDPATQGGAERSPNPESVASPEGERDG